MSLDYSTSILNPGLKLGITLLYLGIVYLYYKAAKRYERITNHDVLLLLLWAGVFGFWASFARYFEYGDVFGFTKEFSLKWFQSVFYVIQSGLFAVASYRLFRATRD